MSNKRTGQILGELEKEIMEFLWEADSSVTVREVVDRIRQKRQVAYTTIMTIMNRLVDKGILVRKLKGSSYLYQPRVSRDQFIAKAAHRIFSTAVSNLGEGVASYFLKEIQKLGPKKRQELLKILDGKKLEDDY